MGVTVRLARRVAREMFVTMMFIVDVTVVVDQLFMVVLVTMTLSKVEPNADYHKCRSDKESRCGPVAKQQE